MPCAMCVFVRAAPILHLPPPPVESRRRNRTVLSMSRSRAAVRLAGNQVWQRCPAACVLNRCAWWLCMCRTASSEVGLDNLTKALRGIKMLLDDRVLTLRKQQDIDQDATLARRLQQELEQEDVRRQVCLLCFSPLRRRNMPKCFPPRAHPPHPSAWHVRAVNAPNNADARRCGRRKTYGCCKSFSTRTQHANCAAQKRT